MDKIHRIISRISFIYCVLENDWDNLLILTPVMAPEHNPERSRLSRYNTYIQLAEYPGGDIIIQFKHGYFLAEFNGFRDVIDKKMFSADDIKILINSGAISRESYTPGVNWWSPRSVANYV